MDELHMSTILGQALGTGTAVAAVLLILWKVLSKIADRFIAALDNVAAGLREHTSKDLASHAELGQHILTGHVEVKEAIIRVEAKLDAVRDWRRRD
jgi:hypothetical protein